MASLLSASCFKSSSAYTVVMVIYVIKATLSTGYVNGNRFEWKTSDWQPCLGDMCGSEGRTFRNVTCMDTHSNQIVLHSSCSNIQRPAYHRKCLLICDLHRYQYHWRKTTWSPCEPRSGKRRCEEDFGTQYRNVTCVSSCGTAAPDEELCSAFEPKPISTRPCDLHCPRDCVMSEFGSWTDCSSCFMTHQGKHRTILAESRYGGRPCRDWSEQVMCARDSTCFELRMSNFQYKLSKWSKCSTFEGGVAKELETYSHIIGIQRRSVQCTNVSGLYVDEKFCSNIGNEPRPVTERLCVLPRDCLVSHWSTWSNWTSLNPPHPAGTSRETYVLRPRYRMDYFRDDANVATRERNLLELPYGSGDKCPALLDTRVHATTTPQHACLHYEWVTGAWSVCNQQGNTGGAQACGKGIQSRAVLCVRVHDRVPVEDFNCIDQTPKHTRKCDLPCPRDCGVSGFGEWSECLPQECSRMPREKGYRQRQRVVLQEEQNGGAACPYLEESQPCEYPLCFQSKVKVNSSQCELRYGDNCGNGTSSVEYGCFDTHGHEVRPVSCLGVSPTSREACHVPCGDDCVVAPWSAWSSCTHSCKSNQVSSFRSRHRTKMTSSSNGGAPCPEDQRHYIEHQNCEHLPSCVTYHWEADAWSQCHAHHARACGAGTQTRITRCYRNTGEEVNFKRCVADLQPIRERNCTVSCRAESCHVSAFTDWSPCPVTCLSGNQSATQLRMRFILRQPEGAACGDVSLYERKECDSLPQCLGLRWRVGAWSTCVLRDRCGDGFAIRAVNCLDANNNTLSEEICISELGNMPDITQSCHVTCDVEQCGYSDWSEWSACPEQCGGVRVRHRRVLSGDYNCRQPHLNRVKETQHCTDCTRYFVQQIGSVSSCILSRDWFDDLTNERMPHIGRQRLSERTCGVGTRYHANVCTDGKGHIMSAKTCKALDFSEEMCMIACPMDCALSEWGEWSTCETSRRCGLGTRSRYRYRKREAVDGGRKCPPMNEGEEEYQDDMCYAPCELYEWQVGGWTSCTPHLQLEEGPFCGPGFQTRAVKCTLLQPDSNGGQYRVEVKASDCSHLPRPPDHNNQCESPCAGQCVLSFWSHWSACATDCSGQQVRQRSIIRSDSHHPHSCAPISDVTDCRINDNCFTYSLQWSEWSRCELGEGQGCGAGTQTRYGECIRSDGTIDAIQHCVQDKDSAHEGGMALGVQTKACQLDCPVDCVVSEWTAWRGCNASCGLGSQNRGRHVIIQPRHGGRSCPPEMTQTRPCSFSECFKWTVSEWSDCNIERHSCGYGRQSRELRCERHDGVAARTALCPEGGKTFFNLERECLKPCAGDCVTSEWSSWGLCHRPCVDGITEGSQTRSRAVISPASPSGVECPADLIHTRACQDAQCPAYSWRTSRWIEGQRNVWCERDVDRKKVQGGCPYKDTPPVILTCNPPCDVTHSYCFDTNWCSCYTGYEEILDKAGDLTECRGSRNTSKRNESRNSIYDVLPEESSSNIWMYAVIAAGTAFIVFVIVAIYVILKHSRKDEVLEQSLQNTRSTILRNSTALRENRIDKHHYSPPLLPKPSLHEDIHHPSAYKHDIT